MDSGSKPLSLHRGQRAGFTTTTGFLTGVSFATMRRIYLRISPPKAKFGG